MKTIFALLFFSLANTNLMAGELRQEIDSNNEAFHHALHLAAEMYLVCYYQLEQRPLQGGCELKIKATIVEVIRGELKVGDRIEFTRFLDDNKANQADFSGLVGSLKYVQYKWNDQSAGGGLGKLEIDAQDPQALFGHSADFAALAAQHKQAPQKSAAASEAGDPEAKIKGCEKPKPARHRP